MSSWTSSSFKSSAPEESMSIASISLKEEQEDPAATHHGHSNYVSSHVHIKPTHTSQPLDKDVVLRRIRQRKRVNRVRAALQALLISSPFSPPVHENKWVDDAFAAP
ncbi:unnamed protein product [Prunus armeniaca]|uniref:Uncharacterized protein n=1 Tax=Prunus armeniaca TaxID=36596 RepID=A0A6J5TRE7_PRUAR|nr:hypothetical protein GBA52_001884 [Prunus armeniaca]CAB4265797.1 unnamed protein product [Prunus armeniaca]